MIEHFFMIAPQTLNLFSFMLGMFFAATLWRVRAMLYVTIYFICVSVYFGFLYYYSVQGV
jgi:hypothetical protein